MHDEEIRHHASKEDGLEITHGIVGQFRIQSRIDRESRGVVQDRISVRVRFRDEARADNAGPAATVIDDELLPERWAKLTEENARERVGTSARCVGYDHPYRPLRVRLLRECSRYEHSGAKAA